VRSGALRTRRKDGNGLLHRQHPLIVRDDALVRLLPGGTGTSGKCDDHITAVVTHFIVSATIHILLGAAIALFILSVVLGRRTATPHDHRPA
jgi:hypothetical protein